MSQSDYSEDERSSVSAQSTKTTEESGGEESYVTSEDDSSEEQDEIDVWAKIQNQAIDRHQQDYEVLVDKFRQDGDSDEVAGIKAYNGLLPAYRKELREVLFDELKWMHLLKRDPVYKKIMETKNTLTNVEDYGWEEAMESAIQKRKFLLNKQFVKEELPKESKSHERFHPYSRNYNGY